MLHVPRHRALRGDELHGHQQHGIAHPLDGAGAVTPWITIYEHKAQADGTAWPVKSSGNLVRNNIAARQATGVYAMPATAGTADHNIVTTAYATYFRNFAGFDAALLPAAPAVNAGLNTGAPSTDFTDSARTTPYDIGAFEYLPRLYEPFDYLATTKINTVASSTDYGFEGATWTGAVRVLSPGLTYSGLTTVGNALQFSSNVSADRSIDMQELPLANEQVTATA